MSEFHGTTILCVKKNGQVALAGDGQVTLGATAVKHNAKKIRKMYSGEICAGFAGSTADAMTLFDKFEGKLEEFRGNLQRAAVELAKEWRTDRILRRLEALLIVANSETMLIISGSGDIIEPDEDVAAIGSGGPFAQAAALALLRHSSLHAREIAERSLEIAAGICIYTNNQITTEVIE